MSESLGARAERTPASYLGDVAAGLEREVLLTAGTQLQKLLHLGLAAGLTVEEEEYDLGLATCCCCLSTLTLKAQQMIRPQV